MSFSTEQVGTTSTTDFDLPAGEQARSVTINFPYNPAEYNIRILYTYPLQLPKLAPAIDGTYYLSTGKCKKLERSPLFSEFRTLSGTQAAGAAHVYECEPLPFDYGFDEDVATGGSSATR